MQQSGIPLKSPSQSQDINNANTGNSGDSSQKQQSLQQIRGASGYGVYLNPHQQKDAVQALAGEKDQELEDDVEGFAEEIALGVNVVNENKVLSAQGNAEYKKQRKAQKEIDDISPLKLNSLKRRSEQLQNQKDMDKEYNQALKHVEDMLSSSKKSNASVPGKLSIPQTQKSTSLTFPSVTSGNAPQFRGGIPSRESNPNSQYRSQQEEEKRQQERLDEEQITQYQQSVKEKHTEKLADYFVTIGVDNYHTEEEIRVIDSNQAQNVDSQTTPDPTKIEEAKKTSLQQLSSKVQLNVLDPDDDFDKIISKLEIFVIRDKDIFKLDHIINGVPINVKHPDDIDNPTEKWIDLRGDKFIYLKITYEEALKCKRPVTDLNFYKISRFKQQQNKMCIHVKQNIEPIPVKEYGDPEADSKFKKTKQLGKEGKGGVKEDMYNFYGDYDLTSYFEDTSNLDPAAQKKNLCLCQSVKRQAPILDVILVIGQQVDAAGQIQVNPITDPETQTSQNLTINWDVPDGYKKLAYSVGTYGFLNRLLCLRNRDVMKRKLKAKVLDRYPAHDRPYYPFPLSISDFCFPSGIMLKTEEGSPEFFYFSLTDHEGTQIFGTCLIFDEEPSQAFKQKLKTMYVRNTAQVRTLKAICILSHYSFNATFKQILMQLYRMQISTTNLRIPIERHITNIIEEIPLPDEGKILVQHEIGGKTASFFRPTDQNPPIVEREEIEILFRCLNVDSIIEIYTGLLLERKVLMVSNHKALLTQVINCFLSFMFPFQWKHPLIPILPIGMIETLDAPFPYLIGIESTPLIDELDIEGDVIRVELDTGIVMVPNDQLMGSHMPEIPFRERKALKTRLQKASEHLMEQTEIPDPAMLEQVDLAFNHACVYDPEEEHLFDHLEIRDAFLEFTSSIMIGYTKYLKDPSEQPEQITCSRDCFDIDKFRLQKDAKKSYSFIYKLTETTHFSYFIECRALGRTERDAQILHFEKLINQKRTRMRPRLIFPFHEEKSIKSMPPNEEGIGPEDGWQYKVFPILNEKYLLPPRPIPDYNTDALQQQIMGSLIRNEELVKMHDNEWARYMLEVLYLLWFQVFCTTLPIYGAHAPNLIDFARKLLNHIRNRIKPMKDIEFIYRRLFESCGTCKQITHLCELNKEMIKNNIQPDKVTSGTYFQALLQCKRRAGTKEDEQDKRKSYFAHRMEDYQAKLNHPMHQDSEDNRSQNRVSNLSLNRNKQNSSASQNVFERKNSSHFQEPDNALADDEQILGVVDFGDVLERREITQQTALETQAMGRLSNPSQKLSYVLENSLYLEIEKSCSKCKEYLREEEIFTGFQKNLSNHTVKCPICKECFVPKFQVYSEQDNIYIKGRKGQTISLLPPVTLYKEFFNIITKKGDQILMSESFIVDHQLVFWNIILYFKIIKLPIFMLDLDYTPYHQKVHCSQIKKFLPAEKNKPLFGGIQSRKNSQTRLLPPKLDSSALKKLNEIDQSPQRFGQGNHDNDRMSQNGGRPSSIKRVASSVINMFSASKKQSSSNMLDENNTSQPANLDSSYNRIKDGVPALENLQPKSLNFDDKKISLRSNQNEPLSSSLVKKSGGVQGIHFNNQNSEAMSQAIENNNKGVQNMVNTFLSLKKPLSQKSGGKGGSQKSGGAGSVITSISDLEKIEKIMNEAQHADKNIVKYFGKHFEEFRREMHYNKEIVLSDLLLDDGLNEHQNIDAANAKDS